MTDQQPTPPTDAPEATPEAPEATPDAPVAAEPVSPPPPPTQPVPPVTAASSGGGGNRNLLILAAIVVIGLAVALIGAQSGIIGGGASASPEPSPSAVASPSAPGSASAEPSATTNPPIASLLTLGGPPECPQRPFCAVGLKDTYGLEFKEFKPLDVGGPLTVEALKSDQIQVGLLFTSDPNIVVNGFVALEDDKHLQNADNIVPVVRKATVDASPGLAGLIDPFMDKLSQDALLDLNRRVGVDQEDPKVVVGEWLAANGLQTSTAGNGVTVKVGSFNFAESETLGELIAQVLEANGYTVERKFNLGNREIVFPALQAGEIDILAEYAASLLETVNQAAGEATPDVAATVAKLTERLTPLDLVALRYAPATDQNTFAVTSDTATKYGLAKLSDLANPAP